MTSENIFVYIRVLSGYLTNIEPKVAAYRLNITRMKLRSTC